MPDEQPIDVSFNLGDSKTALDQLRTALAEMGSSLDTVDVKFVKLNSEMELSSAAIVQITADHERITRVLQLEGGEVTSLTTKIEGFTKAQEAAAQAAREAAGQKAAQILTGFAPTIPSDLGTDIQEKLQRAQTNLVKALTTPGLADTTINRIVNDLEKGLIRVETGPAANLQRAILRVKDAAGDVNASIQKAAAQASQAAQATVATRFTGQVTAQFPAPTTGNVNQILAYNNALQRLQQAIVASNATAPQLNNLLQQAGANATSFATNIRTLPPNLQQVATALTQVAGAANTMGTVTTQAGQGVLLTFTNVVRLFERIVIYRTIGLITQALRAGFADALEYSIKLQQVANVAQQVGPAVGQLDSQIRQLSERFAIPQIEVLRASQSALTSQLGDTAKGFELLQNASRLSVSTGIDLASSTKLLTTSLQAFNLTGNESGRVANQLFIASQKTRIPIDELQNAIGRVGPAAQRLGISFEEVLGSFINLAAQGVRPTEALSSLSLVFSRLLEPSKEMKIVFDSLGTSTGPAAVATFGYQGVLQQLNKVIEESPDKLGELAGSMRTLRGLLGLTGDQTASLTRNIQELGSATGQVGAATQNIQVLPEQKINQAIQRVKNIFTQDLGRVATGVASNIIDAFGGVEGAISAFTLALKAATEALLVYKGLQILTTAEIGTFGKVLTAVRLTLFTFGNELVRTGSVAGASKAAFGGIVTVAGGLTAVIGAAALALIALNTALEQIETARLAKIAESTEQIRAALEHSKEVQANAASEETKAVTTEIDKRYQAILQGIAKQVVAAKAAKDQIVQQQKEAADAIKATGTTFLDTLRTKLSDVRRSVSEAEAAIREAQAAPTKFAEEIGKTQAQLLIGNTDSIIQQQEFIRQRERQLADESKKQRDLNDKGTIESQRQVFEERKRLIQEDAKAEKERARALAEVSGQTTVDENGRQRIITYVNLTKFQLQLNDLVREEAAFNAAIVKSNQDRINKLREQEAIQKRNLQTAEDALKALDQFRGFTPEGKVEPRFAKAGPTLDQQQAAALAEFDQRVARARAAFAAAQPANDFAALQARRAFDLQTIELKSNLEKQFQAQRREQEIETNRLTVEDRQKRTKEAIVQEIRDRQEAANEVSQRVAKAGELLNQALGGTSLDTLFSKFKQIIGEFSGLSGISLQDQQKRVNAIRIAIEEAQAAIQRFNVDRTTQSAEEAAAAITKIRVAAGNVDLTKIIIPDSGKSIADTLQRAVDNINVGKATAGKAKTASESLQNLLGINVEELDKVIANLPKSFQDVQGQAAATGKSIGEGFSKDAAGGVNTFIDRIEAARRALEDLAKVRPTTIPVPTGGGLGLPGEPLFQASGGPIGFPRGTDTVPAWLTPGEYVMDAGNTRRFYSQLVSMSKGIQPRYYASGGVVVGDIHVNVQGGDTSEVTIREIGRGLRRELRRGTISLK
jgi:TP901 family phage tail tape measure protein